MISSHTRRGLLIGLVNMATILALLTIIELVCRKLEQVMVDLINQLPSPRGVVVSITEDMPPDRWQHSCKAIMDGLDRHARENPSLYNPN